jgi:hypothetical protein
MMPPMRMMAMGGLFGHLLFGMILSMVFLWMRYRAVSGAPLRA